MGKKKEEKTAVIGITVQGWSGIEIAIHEMNADCWKKALQKSHVSAFLRDENKLKNTSQDHVRRVQHSVIASFT